MPEFCSVKKPVLTVFFLLILILGQSQPVITYQSVIAGLSAPVDVVNAGDGTNRIFVVEQGGAIKVFGSDFSALGTFLTVTGLATGGEQGLLSLAFHPSYENNGFFWVYYTNSAGNLELSRYKVSAGNPNAADPNSRQVVLTIPHPGQTNHNGGKLNFGPDGYLYFATGDGGGGGDPSNNAQNGGNLLGKMLRIDVSTGTVAPFYTVPTDNPYVSNAGVQDEIWALGLRNPFRWSFDRSNGDMWIGDVGQGAREEINFRSAGSTGGINYGWRCYEGNLTYNTSGCAAQSAYVFPVYDYPNPPTSAASVTGGIVYRGTQFPSMQGWYFAADVYSGNLYKINKADNFNTSVQTGLPNLVVGFGETESGELLAASLNGNVYSLRTSTPTSVNEPGNVPQPQLYPTLVTGKRFTLYLPAAYQWLQVVSTNGSVLLQQNLAGRTGAVEVWLPNLSPGVYVVKVQGRNSVFKRKIIVK